MLGLLSAMQRAPSHLIITVILEERLCPGSPRWLSDSRTPTRNHISEQPNALSEVSVTLPSRC